MPDKVKHPKLISPEKQAQHNAVTDSATHNLNLVIDQIDSLDSDKYDEVLECLDSAKTALEKARG